MATMLLTINTVHSVRFIAVFLTLGLIDICSSKMPGYECLATSLDICLDAIACPVAATVPDPENCNQYFICNGSSLYPAFCEAGKKFNINFCECTLTNQCAGSCTDNSYMSHIVTTSSPEPTSSSTKVIPTEPSTTTFRVPPVVTSTTTVIPTSTTTTPTSTTTTTSTTSTSTTMTTTTPIETTTTTTATTPATSTSSTTTTPVPTTPSSATSSPTTTTSTPPSTSTTSPSSSVFTTTATMTTTPVTTTTTAIPTLTSSTTTTVSSTPTPTTTTPSSTTTTATPTSTTNSPSSTSTATTTDAPTTSTTTSTVTTTPLPSSTTTSPTPTSPTTSTSTTPTSTPTTASTPSSSTTTIPNIPSSTTNATRPIPFPSSTTPLPASSSTTITLPTMTRTVELTTSATPGTSSTPITNSTGVAVVTPVQDTTSSSVAPSSISTNSTTLRSSTTSTPNLSTAVTSTSVPRAMPTSADRSTVRSSTSTSPATSMFPVNQATTISLSTSGTTFSRTSRSTVTIPHTTTVSLPPANQATNTATASSTQPIKHTTIDQTQNVSEVSDYHNATFATVIAASLNVSIVTESTTLPTVLQQNTTTSAALDSSTAASSFPSAFTVSSISGVSSSSTPYFPDLACAPELPCHLGSRIADPGNCGKYFECVQNPNGNRWMSQPCTGYKKFDYFRLDCVDGSSAICHPICNETIVHTVDMFPSVPLEGAALEFTCKFRYIFPQNQVEVQRFAWFLNGAKITPTFPGITVGESGPDDKGLWLSKLTFNPALPRYSGAVHCIVNFGNGRSSAVSSIPYHVVALPSVTVDPLMTTVFVGDVFTLRCRLNVKSPVDQSFVWLRNGINFTVNNVTETITRPEPGLSTLSSTATHDVQYSCYAVNRAGSSSQQTSSVYVIERNSAFCDMDNAGLVNWTLTKADTTCLAHCPLSFVGTATRRCELDTRTATARWLNPDFTLCLHKDLAQLLIDVHSLSDGVGVDNSSAVESLALRLTDIVTTDRNMSLTDWGTSVQIVTLLADIHRDHADTNVTTNETTAIVRTVGLLCGTNYASYLMTLNVSDGSSAVKLMRAVDIYSQALARQLTPGSPPMTLVGNGIVVQLYAEGYNDHDTVTFPFYSEINNVSWIDSSSDFMSINISATVGRTNLNRKRQAVSDSRKSCYFSCAYYSALNDFLPVQPGTNLGSRVLSMAIDSCLVAGQQLVSPVYMTFEQRKQPLSKDMKSHCVYWDYSIGGWSNESCHVIASNRTHTTCSCSHLTNFAILFSPSPAAGINNIILSIISMIGCIISLVGLALTIIFFGVKWKQMKSHHAAVLINLCVALIIANIIFLAGSSQTKFPEWCKAAAVLLHYFFLAAFCLMLAEGIEMLLYIVFVFHVRRRRETAALIFAAWFIPLIIVAISMGVTRLDGYGGTVTCWLSVKTGLLWAFVAPALLIICLNFIILIIVICRISRIKARIDKMETKERMKTTLWNVVVILPILGITWIFGVVAVNHDLVAFQYIFAIANSFQGFFIFIFNTLCNKKASHAKASAKSRSKYSGQRITTNANRSSELNRSTDDIIVIMANIPTPPQDRRENRRVSFAEDNAGFIEDNHTTSWDSSASSTTSSRSDSDMRSNVTSATDLSNPNSQHGSTSHEPLRPILSGTSC